MIYNIQKFKNDENDSFINIRSGDVFTIKIFFKYIHCTIEYDISVIVNVHNFVIIFILL